MVKGRKSVKSINRRVSYEKKTCLIPLLGISTFLFALFVIMGVSRGQVQEHLELSTVTGYFQQDDPSTESNDYDFKKNSFGLINRMYDSDVDFDPDRKKTQWQRFEAEINRLNNQSQANTHYKLLYLGRHGEGYHNLAESFYGTKAWDCYWSLQKGNETTTWVDAELTPLGISQAQAAQKFWANMIESEIIPVPQVYYVSPLLRCQQTAWNTFFGLNLPSERPFKPVIKELLRECIGVHTCDMRSSKTQIQKRYPDWIIEDGFTENDELWSPTLRESDEAMDQRTKLILDEILADDEHTFISISSHSGQIASALRVLGHREFQLGTGQAIPVLIKVDRVLGSLPPVKKAKWFTPETCPSPPK
ncbi:putative phosphoglycerate mutase [Golovinomyces cichoracearum]|uniref:Putative phosphoglycerate mutase n=1 Tax=Golovinomyces cichoracearum TaxID=62708 RepID=A0A420IT24_9PEZI|nr:putative phosphoglycerate mutase [Golovinomyces cichoracearum]